jgi:hypothetical protein
MVACQIVRPLDGQIGREKWPLFLHLSKFHQFRELRPQEKGPAVGMEIA